MGILEGFSSFLGYALMLAVNILFTIFTWHKNMLLIVITCVFRSCLWMLGILLRFSLASSSVKLHLEGLNGVSIRLEHMQRRLIVVSKMLERLYCYVFRLFGLFYFVHGDKLKWFWNVFPPPPPILKPCVSLAVTDLIAPPPPIERFGRDRHNLAQWIYEIHDLHDLLPAAAVLSIPAGVVCVLHFQLT